MNTKRMYVTTVAIFTGWCIGEIVQSMYAIGRRDGLIEAAKVVEKFNAATVQREPEPSSPKPESNDDGETED